MSHSLFSQIHYYKRYERILVAGGYALAFLLLISGIWPGLLILFAATAYALCIDARGVGTLRGQLCWARMSSITRTSFIILWCLFWYFFLFYYGGLIAWEFWSGRSALDLQTHIAHLESELGMMHSSREFCAACQHSIPSGSVYCLFCGEPVFKTISTNTKQTSQEQ